MLNFLHAIVTLSINISCIRQNITTYNNHPRTIEINNLNKTINEHQQSNNPKIPIYIKTRIINIYIYYVLVVTDKDVVNISKQLAVDYKDLIHTL